MLVLSRKVNERIVINDNITITVVEIRGDKTRLGIEAPPEGMTWKKDLPTRWRKPMYMPKAAARLFLRVTGVRCERLQDITEADAIAEGIARLWDDVDEDYRKKFQAEIEGNKSWKNYLWHGHFGNETTKHKLSNEWAHQFSSYQSAVGSYSSYWQLTNGKKHPWFTNPWVWVYEFERIDLNQTSK